MVLFFGEKKNIEPSLDTIVDDAGKLETSMRLNSARFYGLGPRPNEACFNAQPLMQRLVREEYISSDDEIGQHAGWQEGRSMRSVKRSVFKYKSNASFNENIEPADKRYIRVFRNSSQTITDYATKPMHAPIIISSATSNITAGSSHKSTLKLKTNSSSGNDYIVLPDCVVNAILFDSASLFLGVHAENVTTSRGLSDSDSILSGDEFEFLEDS